MVEVFLDCFEARESNAKMDTFLECLPEAYGVFCALLLDFENISEGARPVDEEKAEEAKTDLLEKGQIKMILDGAINGMLKNSRGFAAEMEMILYILRCAPPAVTLPS